jgi:hypothetical protein
MQTAHPASIEACEFQLRTRFSWEGFQELVNLFRDEGSYDESAHSRGMGSTTVPPLDIMILSSLRVLTDNIFFDRLVELSNISRTSHHSFFHRVFLKVLLKREGDFIKFPEDAFEIHQVESLYRLLGFPGCFGSEDGVHIKMLGCPALEYNLHTSKERYPTRAFQVVCDHQMKILIMDQ